MWLIVVVLGFSLLGAGCAGTDNGEALELEAVLAGQTVADATAFNPVELHHEEVTSLEIDVRNVTGAPVTISHVRLEGQMLDFIFLSYDTGINETLAPGERRRIAFTLDFFDLEGQAHGLLRANLRLFGPEREPLGQTPFIVDGRGSPLATMATFNLVLALLAAVSLAWNLFRLAQRQLPAHRFARGLRFVHTGAAVGLAVSAACSTLRIWPLSTVTWVLVTVVAALVAFAAGYASPGADDETLIIDLNAPVPTVVPTASHDPLTAAYTGPAGPVDNNAFRVTNPIPGVEKTPERPGEGAATLGNETQDRTGRILTD